jgi:hypothetical protein
MIHSLLLRCVALRSPVKQIPNSISAKLFVQVLCLPDHPFGAGVCPQRSLGRLLRPRVEHSSFVPCVCPESGNTAPALRLLQSQTPHMPAHYRRQGFDDTWSV